MTVNKKVFFLSLEFTLQDAIDELLGTILRGLSHEIDLAFDDIYG
jgi:hypothetical protein